MSTVSEKSAVTAVATRPAVTASGPMYVIEREALEWINRPSNRVSVESRCFLTTKILQATADCAAVRNEAAKEGGRARELREQLAEARREAAELHGRLAATEARLAMAISMAGPGPAGCGPAASAGAVPAPSGAGGSVGAPAGRMDYASALRAGLAPSTGAARGGPAGAATTGAGTLGVRHKCVAFLTPLSQTETPARDVLRLLKNKIDPKAKNIRDVTFRQTSVPGGAHGPDRAACGG
ncbi:uncharacterized protein [Dermacentor albipictus]|uniref:uncharacterized protein n=1 Tax=Dermacentor albipictus TaxID=60249 RepID=UPI0038FC7A5B